MSPSSASDSPNSATGTVSSRAFPLPGRDSFIIDIPSPQLTNGNANGAGTALKSPTSDKLQRVPSFGRDGILGAVGKARNLSQSSSDAKPDMNGLQNAASDDGVNPLKRRNTDATVDYPRRRATIAVRWLNLSTPLRASSGFPC